METHELAAHIAGLTEDQWNGVICHLWVNHTDSVATVKVKALGDPVCPRGEKWNGTQCVFDPGA